jgi:ureidoacrylate peracid hydrolase
MTFEEKISPPHTALVIIDVQRDYFSEGGIIEMMGFDFRELQVIIEPLKRFLKESRKYLKTIIFTRQTRYRYLRSPVLVEHYTRAKMMRPFDPGIEEFYEIIPEPDDIILPKHRYSAFIGTPFDGILRANQIKTLILTGVAANVCVESTARDGFMMDYHIVVPSDLTAGVSEQTKRVTLYNIGTFFGEIVKSEHILETWASSSTSDPTNGR